MVLEGLVRRQRRGTSPWTTGTKMAPEGGRRDKGRRGCGHGRKAAGQKAGVRFGVV